MTQNPNNLHPLLQYSLWPFLLVVPLIAFWGVWQWLQDPAIAIFIIYVPFFVLLIGLERVLPYKRAWLDDRDGQTPVDLGFIVLYFVISAAAGAVILKGLIWAVDTWQPLLAFNIWPSEWPLWLQVVLGMFITDLGNNLAHRLAHEWSFLWRFHAVHHSSPRLTVINTARFHPVDVIKSSLLGAPIPFLLGAPSDVVAWYAALSAFTGVLTHCNVDVRCGIFNYIFSTPELHRWHHSRVVAEGNSNYGEVTVLWDHIFSSFYHPQDRKPPVNVGTHTPVPRTFLGLMWQPFRLKGFCEGQPTLTELPENAS